jgi:hypothetical protein
MSRLTKFLTLSHADRNCLIEAGFWLGLARLAILMLPFRWIAPVLGKNMVQTPQSAEDADGELLDRISWALTTASRHLPWDCKCLPRAMAGMAMLKRRRITSTLYLGLAKDDDEAKLQAHAWLRCGNRIITGEKEMTGFTTIATFAEEEK